MSNFHTKQPKNQVPNGSDTESDPPPDHNKGEEEAPGGPPACPPGARCQEQVSRLKRILVERKNVYQTSLDRLKAASLKKDAAFKALKTKLEAQQALAKSQLDAARQAMYSKWKKTEADLKARFVSSEAELKRQADDLRAANKVQARDLKQVQSNLSTARLSLQKSASQVTSVNSKTAIFESENSHLKKQLSLKEKEVKKLTCDLQAALK